MVSKALYSRTQLLGLLSLIRSFRGISDSYSVAIAFAMVSTELRELAEVGDVCFSAL